jgi:hypothetical protein
MMARSQDMAGDDVAPSEGLPSRGGKTRSQPRGPGAPGSTRAPRRFGELLAGGLANALNRLAGRAIRSQRGNR